MSRNSDGFVDNLKAAKQFMSAESVILYKKQLAKWKLSAVQWETLLQWAISQSEPGRVPELGEIYAEIKHEQLEAPKDNLGWAYFRLNEKPFAIRIEVDSDRTWRITDLTSHNRKGEIIHHQKHIGEPVLDHIPAHATDFDIKPDNEAWPREEVLVSDLERKQFMETILGNLARIGSAA